MIGIERHFLVLFTLTRMASSSSSSSSLQESIRATSTELLARLCDPGPTRQMSTKKAIGKAKKQQEATPGNETKRIKLDEGNKEAADNTLLEIEREKPEETLRKLKLLCKKYPEEAPPVVCQLLLKSHLSEGRTSTIRERAVQIADELFQRSAKFRNTLCESLRVFMDAVFGDSVPGPKAAKLSATATDVLRKWTKNFGNFYPQLGLALASERIPLEPSTVVESGSRNEARQLQDNVDEAVVERVERGFKIYDGTPLSGLGEAEATLITTAVEKLNEMRNGLMLLLPIIFDENESSNDTGHGDGRQAAVVEYNEEDIEWEDDEAETILPTEEVEDGDGNADEDEEEELAGFYIPQDFNITLTMPSGDDEDSQAIRQALLDCRLTVERSLLPEIVVWADSIERVLLRSPKQQTAQLLVRVKHLLSDLRTAVARCDRLQIRSRKSQTVVPSATRRKNPSSSSSSSSSSVAT